MSRSTAAAIWAAIVLFGLGVLLVRLGDTSKPLEATRQMPANHLLRASDLRGRDATAYVGRYLLAAVGEHGVVTKSGVIGAPVLSADGRPLLAVSIRPGEGMLEPREGGSLYDGATLLAPAEVVAVVCPDERRACIVLVSMTLTAASEKAVASVAHPADISFRKKP